MTTPKNGETAADFNHLAVLGVQEVKPFVPPVVPCQAVGCNVLECEFVASGDPCYGEIHPATDGGEEGPTNIVHTCEGHDENGCFTPWWKEKR